MENVKFFTGFVDVNGASVKKLFTGLVDVVDNQSSILKLNLGNNKIITDETQFGLNQLQVVTGIINDNVNNNDIPVSGVRVSFIKDYTVSNLNDNQYNGNQVVVDYDITDSNGRYVVYIKPGNYAIRIDGDKFSQHIPNQEIENGLINPYYFTLEGLIYKKYDDIIEFNNSTKKLISGIILDEHDKPLNNAEIIISLSQDPLKIISYFITDERGRYNFVLENGIYDIRMRAPKQPIEIVKNFEFKDNQSFVLSLQEKSSFFKKNNWISFYK